MPLLTPLFGNDGNYNAAKVQMRFNEVMNVTTSDGLHSYTMYEKATKKPEVDYVTDPIAQRYLHVLVNGYAVPVRATLGYLAVHYGADDAIIEVYGSETARETFFNDDSNTPDMRETKLKEEREAARRIGLERTDKIADHVHRWLAQSEERFINAKKLRERGDWVWPDCIGACVAQELQLWLRLDREYKQHRDMEEQKEQEAKDLAESAAMAEAIDALNARVEKAVEAIRSCNATIKNDQVTVYLMSPNSRGNSRETHFINYLMEQKGVAPKGRTPGWINQHLGEIEVHKDPVTGGPKLRMWFSGNAKHVPNGVEDALWRLIHAIQDN